MKKSTQNNHAFGTPSIAPTSENPALTAASRLSDFSLTGEQRTAAVADLKAAVADEEAGQ